MLAHQFRPGAAPASNDNGVPAIAPQAAPRDILTVAKHVCRLVILSYVAGGSSVVKAAHARSGASAAA